MIPVTVIGGYLGSGKTTLVNHLLRHADGKRLAIMVNEFGELPIDEDLIEASSENMVTLAGGCVCCSYGNGLVEAMNGLAELEPQPDNVILEASGVALPGVIAGTLSLLQGFTVDGVLVLADAETVREYASDKYMADTITRQLADADMVLLNKTDLVSGQAVEDLREWFGGYAPGARVIETVRSVVPPGVVLQNFVQVGYERQGRVPHHEDGFVTEVLDIDEVSDVRAFAEDLIADNPGMVRAKGFIREVSGGMKTLQVVGKRFEVGVAPVGASSGVV